MGARFRSTLSHLRSKPLGSSLTLVGVPSASTTLWPRSTWPHCQPASALLECSRLWAWARVGWGCAAASLLPLMCSLVRTQPTGGHVSLVEAGGSGRFPSSQWGKWSRSLRSWPCQTQIQAWCPVLDRPAPPWLPFQIWGFLGFYPLGKWNRKQGLNKSFWNSSVGAREKHPLLPECFDLWLSFERLIFYLEGLLAASFHSLRDPGPAIDSLHRTQLCLSTKQNPHWFGIGPERVFCNVKCEERVGF